MEKTSVQEALPKMQAILRDGQTCRLLVTGTSMTPFLRHDRDAVILTPYHAAHRGDILFYFRTPESCVLHRVHKVCRDGTFLMCGDAQQQLEPIIPQQIIAAVSHVERSGKYIDCRQPFLRLKVRLWQMLRPLRPYLLQLMRKLHMISMQQQ